MSTRPILVAAGVLAVITMSACSTRYSQVYNYRKTSFQAPVKKTATIEMPAPQDPTAGQAAPPGTVPGAPDASGIPGIPGVTPAPAPGAAAPTGIPGLDPAPAPVPPAQ